MTHKSHGGKRENSGRKKKLQDQSKEAKQRWNDSHKRIYLTERIYQSWIDAKCLAGYNSCSDSDFAVHLLSLEYRRKSFHDVSHAGKRSRTTSTPADEQYGAFPYEGPQTSTPVKRSGLVPFSTSPIGVSAKNLDQLENMDCDSPVLEPSTSLHDASSVLVSMVLACGNTSQGPNCSMFSDDEGESAEEISSNEGVSDQELYRSVIEELNAEKNLDSYVESEEDSLIDDEDGEYGDGGVVLEKATEENEISDTVHVQSFLSDVSDDDADGPEYGPHLKLTREEEIPAFKREFNLVKESKFICSLDLLLEVFVQLCQISGCLNVPQVNHHFVGTTLVINCSCPSGHKFRFCSSHKVNGIYVNNLQASAAVLLSGNNYGKIKRMADFFTLAFPSNRTYFRMQRLYFIPAVDEWWCWMRCELVKEFAGKDIIVGGDGQCDSPGFSAKNLCYFLVEVTSSYILEIEVCDKCHVGLASTNMEREALKNALHRQLKKVIKVVELVTDASSSIKKLVSTEFKEIVHSLDVWHKSKSIRKCLSKVVFFLCNGTNWSTLPVLRWNTSDGTHQL